MSNSILIFAAAAGLLAAQSNVGTTWNGSLLDDSCRSTNITAKCEITAQTSMFGVATDDGRYFKLDVSGNAKAREALAEKKKTGSVMVDVDGQLDGEMIKVTAIKIR
jgi:hypothetical protein